MRAWPAARVPPSPAFVQVGPPLFPSAPRSLFSNDAHLGGVLGLEYGPLLCTSPQDGTQATPLHLAFSQPLTQHPRGCSRSHQAVPAPALEGRACGRGLLSPESLSGWSFGSRSGLCLQIGAPQAPGQALYLRERPGPGSERHQEGKQHLNGDVGTGPRNSILGRGNGECQGAGWGLGGQAVGSVVLTAAPVAGRRARALEPPPWQWEGAGQPPCPCP